MTLGGWDPGNGAELSLGVLGILVTFMICVSFGFDRRMCHRVARGPFLHAAIGFQTRPYNSASTTVLHVISVIVILSLKMDVIDWNESIVMLNT